MKNLKGLLFSAMLATIPCEAGCYEVDWTWMRWFWDESNIWAAYEPEEIAFQPQKPYWKYTIPGAVQESPFSDEAPSETVYETYERHVICGGDSNCWAFYPMTEYLFSSLQLRGWEINAPVSRVLVQ